MHMTNPDPNHVKGSHPHAAEHAAKGIVWYVVPPDAQSYPTRHDAAAYASLIGGRLTRTVADHGDDAPADTTQPADEPNNHAGTSVPVES